AFAAAFLGATAIIPGQFNAWGSWIAVYFLLTGITGLSMAGYAGWPERVFYGGALLVAGVVQQVAARARRRPSRVAVSPLATSPCPSPHHATPTRNIHVGETDPIPETTTHEEPHDPTTYFIDRP